MKNILILGGTGAMGKALVPLLKKNNKVSVTTRSHRVNKDIEYIIVDDGSTEDAL